jgi:esterase
MQRPGTIMGTDEARQMISRDGAVLAYRRWAPAMEIAGPPLVLLHGAASNATRWWHFVAHTRLAGGRVLLRPDLRGHGDSVWRGPARMRHWVDDLAALLGQEGEARAVLVGHCLGANLAIHFAAAHPASCAGLVLVEPMPRAALAGPLAWARRLAPLLDLAARSIGCLNRLGLHRRALDRVDLEMLDQPVHAARGGNVEGALAVHGSLRHDLRVVPSAQLLANFVELARPLPVEAVRCPSLVVLSSGRHMTDPQRVRERLAPLPATTVVELPSEHWIPATHPERLCELIDAWVLRQTVEAKP